MQKRIVIAMVVTLAILVAGCGGKQTAQPTSISIVEKPAVSLETPQNQQVMVVGDRSKFSVKLDPEASKASVSGVKVWGDSGITCIGSEESDFVWYCVGAEPVDVATVFVKVSGDFPDSEADYTVQVVRPTPTPTPVEPGVSDTPPPTPTPTPMEPGVTDTPPPTPTPTPVEPGVTDTPPPPPPGTVTLVSPQGGQIVPCENVATGTYDEAQIKDPIWPMVYVTGRYFPQDDNGNAPPMLSGEWWGTVRFGDCNNLAKDVGRNFQLIVYTAGKDCRAVIRDYLDLARSTGSYPGIEELPEDCIEHVRITVVRK